MSKRAKTNRICTYTGFEDQEDEFADLRTVSLLKHASRVNRNDRVRNSARRDSDNRENGSGREKNLRRSERI